MKVIISGGLGYVGGRISEYLSSNGVSVTALSRQAKRLPLFKCPANMTIKSPDEALEDLSGYDAFIHLAAVNEVESVQNPRKAIEVNVTETVEWLDVAWRQKIPRFIYFSTAHVYAKPLVGFFDENTITHPLHPYSITHRCAEDYVLMYAAEKGMNNLVIRLSNAFGGPAFPTADRWTLLVNDICRSAIQQNTITLQTDGLQQRDFICMEDVCRAVAHLLQTTSTIAFPNPVFNVAAGKSMSVFEMTQTVRNVAQQMLQKEIELIRKPEGIRQPALTLSVKKLLDTGFRFTHPIEAEIISTLKFFQGQDRND